MTHVSPFRRPGFAALFATQLTSALNDNLFKNALMLWITVRQAGLFGLSPSAMLGLVSAVFIAPFLLLSGTAGQLADRFDKTRVARAVKWAEVAIMALAALGFVGGSLPVMLGALFLMGAHSALLGPVKYSILPELVPGDGLLRANALVEMGTFLAILVGTVLGGLLAVLERGPELIALGVLTIALVGLAASYRLPTLAPSAPSLRVARNPVTPMVEILRITARVRGVFLATLGISFFWLVGVVMLSFLPSYVHGELGAEERVVTLLFALFCVGIAAGSLLTERISRGELELGLVPIGALGMTLCLADLALLEMGNAGTTPLSLRAFLAAPGAVHLCLDLFLLAMCGGLFTVPLYTLIQARTAPAERSRVVAGNNILNALFMVAGSLLLSLFSSTGLAGRWAFLGLAALCLAATVYICLLLPEFLMRFVAFVLSRTAYRLEIDGREHLPAEGPAVLVCNHVAFNDWLIVAGSVRRPVRFVMDHRIAGTPLVSALLRAGKVIPIAPAHEDEALMERAFVRIAEELRAGEIVCIYPEGKITRTGDMNPFKSGVERILAETPVPVIPMAVHGLWGSVFSRKDGPALHKLPRRFRARLALRIGPGVEPGKATAKSLEHDVRTLLARAEKDAA